MPAPSADVWSGGVGRYLTIEFGKSHLLAQEPRGHTLHTTARLQRRSRIRRVHVCGDWHLFIQGDWKIAVEDEWLHSDNEIVQHSVKEDFCPISKASASPSSTLPRTADT